MQNRLGFDSQLENQPADLAPVFDHCGNGQAKSFGNFSGHQTVRQTIQHRSFAQLEAQRDRDDQVARADLIEQATVRRDLTEDLTESSVLSKTAELSATAFPRINAPSGGEVMLLSEAAALEVPTDLLAGSLQLRLPQMN